jgi:NhaP-type Na+/H+ or K+/H+ antiporter
VVWLRGHLTDAPVEITVSLLTPFAAYIPAERLGLSGVLAAATSGVCIGWAAPRIMASETRLRGRAVWDFLVFVLNGLAFILIGLQLSTIVAQRPTSGLAQPIEITLVVAAALILARLRSRRRHGASPCWSGGRGCAGSCRWRRPSPCRCRCPAATCCCSSPSA